MCNLKIFLTTLFLVYSVFGFCQNSISGTIVDSETNEPVPFASVVIDGTSIGVIAGEDGTFNLVSNEAFPWILTASSAGLSPASVEVTESNSELSISLSVIYLEEVIVTVQKRAQSAQDVPTSVTVINGSTLMDQNATQLEDLQIPSVEISNGFQGPIISMRGISTSANRGLEQSVGTFIDGVYAGRSELAIAQFLDVDQLEVLKGPQPVFFGQSAIAGALSILSNKPNIGTKEGYINVKAATQADYSVDFGVSIPISRMFATRIAARYNYLDGPFKNSLTDSRIMGNNSYGGRLTTLFKPNDKLDITLKLDYNVVNGETPVLQSVNEAGTEFLSGLTYAAGGADPNHGGYSQELNFIANSGGTLVVPDITAAGARTPGVVARNLNEAAVFNADFRDLDVLNSSLYLNYKLGNGFTLSTISAFSQFESNLIIDLDGSAYALFNNNAESEFDQFSQEIRLTSPENKKFNWMIGGYYQTSDLMTDARRFQALNTITPSGNRTEENSTWSSIFLSGSINLVDKLFLEPGVRYTSVSKEGNKYDLISGIGVNTATDYIGRSISELTTFSAWIPQDGEGNELLDLTVSDNVITSAVSLVWKGEKTTYYARVAQGFKAGGFNANAAITPDLTAEDVTFGSELATSYELGIKTRPSSKWRHNIAFYYTDYDDLQVSSYLAEIDDFVVSNAARASILGLEFDGQYRFSRTFSLNYNAAFLNATYQKFLSTANVAELEDANNLRLQGQSSPYGLAQITSIGASGIVTEGLVDRSGDDLSFAPKWEFSLNPQSRIRLNENILTIGLTYRLKDDHFVGTNFNDADIQESYGRLDCNIRFMQRRSNWSVSAYGRNLTNEVIKNAGNDGSYIIARGSNAGLQFRYDF